MEKYAFKAVSNPLWTVVAGDDGWIRRNRHGGIGEGFEFTGLGIETVSVPEKCTIMNITAGLGATTGVFPSDERIKIQSEYALFIGLRLNIVVVIPVLSSDYSRSR